MFMAIYDLDDLENVPGVPVLIVREVPIFFQISHAPSQRMVDKRTRLGAGDGLIGAEGSVEIIENIGDMIGDKGIELVATTHR